MNTNMNPDLAAFLANYPADVQTMAYGARTLILEVMPNTIELIDPSANLIAYGLDRGYKGLICGITMFKAHINIMLAQGASLPDPQGLLKGTGKLARHIKVTQLADLNNPGARALLQEAFQRKAQEWHKKQ
jgi:hypothetical protein